MFGKFEASTLIRVIFETAKKRNESKTYVCKTFEEAREIINTKPGFIKAMWCGDQDCELQQYPWLCIPQDDQHEVPRQTDKETYQAHSI